MAARELTNCVPPGQDGNPVLMSILAGLGFGSVWAFVFWVAGVGIAGVVLAGLAAAAYAAMIAFCDFFFNSRLVCIRDSDCLVGMVRKQEDSFDGDWTVNVLPAPFPPGSTLLQMQNPAAVQARFFTNQFPAEYSSFKGFATTDGVGTVLVHNEIEGTRMQTWCAATIAALAIAAFAGPIIVAACGPFAWLCALIVLAVVVLISWLGHELGETGSVGDVASDPDAQAIDTADSPAVAIEGRFIFEPQHGAYNELHAVRKIVSIPDDDHRNFDPTSTVTFEISI